MFEKLGDGLAITAAAALQSAAADPVFARASYLCRAADMAGAPDHASNTRYSNLTPVTDPASEIVTITDMPARWAEAGREGPIRQRGRHYRRAAIPVAARPQPDPRTSCGKYEIS